MTQAKFSYEFSGEELKSLAHFLRARQDKLPRELFAFSRAVQDELYGRLSIDEVEKFCKNEIC
ncbi:MAG: hypothetical protein HDR36_05455 [Treponema sp.]|nr:hypothetical protein [Treponema sp.]